MNAYVTYLDKKEYLPGLQGLYYGLKATKTIYPLIIFYSSITENDIKKYIELDGVKLIELPQYNIAPGIRKKDIDKFVLANWNKNGRTIYCNWQQSNIIGPLFAFGLMEYDKIMYLHCDILLYLNIDFIFDIIKIEDKQIVVANYAPLPNGIDHSIHSTHIMLLKPNKEVFNYILKDINETLNDEKILAIDHYLNLHLLERGIITATQIPNIQLIDEICVHFTGVFKYWTMFPKMDIKKLMSLNSLNKLKVINFLVLKYKAMNRDFPKDNHIEKSIWKDNNNLIKEFKSRMEELNG